MGMALNSSIIVVTVGRCLGFYPRAALRKRDICCREVSVLLTRSNIVLKQLSSSSSKFFTTRNRIILVIC